MNLSKYLIIMQHVNMHRIIFILIDCFPNFNIFFLPQSEKIIATNCRMVMTFLKSDAVKCYTSAGCEALLLGVDWGLVTPIFGS